LLPWASPPKWAHLPLPLFLPLRESAAKLAQALEENEKLKKQIEELDLSAANVLTLVFVAITLNARSLTGQ